MISKEVIAQRRKFYLQEFKIELKNARDYLNANADSWKEENEIAYMEFLNRAQTYMDKAEAMEELLQIETFTA